MNEASRRGLGVTTMGPDVGLIASHEREYKRWQISLVSEPIGKFWVLVSQDERRQHWPASVPGPMSFRRVRSLAGVVLSSVLSELLASTIERWSNDPRECVLSIRLEVTLPPSDSGLTSTISRTVRLKGTNASAGPGDKSHKVGRVRRVRTS
jgi:hypothetical protein